MQANVLIVEDSPALAMTYADWLQSAKIRGRIAPSAEAALRDIRNNPPDAILLDLTLPGRSGLELLKDIRAAGISIPVVVVTGDTSADATALAAGADDFISKPVQKERLILTLNHLFERRSLQTIVEGYRAQDRGEFCGFVGRSPAMQVVYRILENAAQSRAPVFITGESGTGKELAARALHALSARKDRVFEALNCAAIPATLIESEMFGHAKGAFTGAVSSFTGAAARADGGTLFLDELGEMPAELQSKLLRFTQTGVFRPVGAREESAVDVRFVSATNREPLSAVRDGKLREDLYYRLNVIPVHLPPLRERGEDAALIAESILHRVAKEEKKHFHGIDPAARDYILSAPWPGNVRQLENVLRRAVVLHDGDMLKPGMLDHGGSVPPQNKISLSPSLPQVNVLPLHEIEKQAIEQAIARCNGNIVQAARQLQVNPSTLHRKLGKWRQSAG